MITSVSVTIFSGQSLSSTVKLNGAALLGIEMPAAWTAANLTFQHSIDGTNFFDMYTPANVEVQVVVSTTQRNVALPTATWQSIIYLKVRSGTSGTPVNQAADRVLKLVCKELVDAGASPIPDMLPYKITRPRQKVPR